ncbi:MAG: type II toxin-antitoxin system VapC family toxin [Deltaproteobacteria bacterium]|nr:type II toxin-antitoxin system VapC family toxin [Deltaproteobacteria bacterium]
MSRRASPPRLFYWDASALVSAVIADAHSGVVRRVAAARDAQHFVSSLAAAEVQVVLGRLVREGQLSAELAREAQARLRAGPWRTTSVQPDEARLGELALRHPLRGADLWHLGAALALRELLPGLGLLSFDERLRAAAEAEGLDVPNVGR